MTKTLPDGFFFDEKTHRYYLNGAQLPGVTTILGVLAKPALIQWAANMACDFVRENYTFGLSEKPEVELEKVLKEARTAHAKKRDASADIGTLAHAWISRFIKGENPAREESLGVITDNFLKWVEEAKPKFLASEKVVYSEKWWFAGCLDFLCEIDGKKFLGDIKTGSGIYPEMFWQTAGYQIALEEHEDIKIDGHIIVNPTKNGKLNVEKHFDWETSQKGFLAALEIYKIKIVN